MEKCHSLFCLGPVDPTETKNCFPCWLDIFLISEEKRKLSRVKRGQKASKDFKMIEFNVSFLS